MIGIINYGLGNLKSVQNIIQKQHGQSIILNSPNDYKSEINKFILPGVGSFDYGMQNLIKLKWIEFLNEHVIKKKFPILGICLGMQLMCKNSDEGILNGLGWIDASVKKFESKEGLKIPHMGWNNVFLKNNHSLFDSDFTEQRFYFVHSYFVKLNDISHELTSTIYDIDFTSSFVRENIFGVQFHPEKSHKYGMNLIKNFIHL